MHFFLLVVGRTHWTDEQYDASLEKQLYPFQELDMGLEERRQDPRARFIDKTEELKAAYWEHRLSARQSLKDFCKWWDGDCCIAGERVGKRGRFGYYDNSHRQWDYWGLSENDYWLLPLKDKSRTVHGLQRDIDFRKLKSSYAILSNGRWHDQRDFIPRDRFGSPDYFNKKRNREEELARWREHWKVVMKQVDPDAIISAIDYHQ